MARFHLIAIGGAIMHNLALALHQGGHQVTGSDDEIFDPAKSRLESAGILPSKIGWDKARIQSDIDMIILGMHAKANNPELLEALALGIPIKSFPEFMYEQSKGKFRVVVSGSHGKTTTTSMIMHIWKSVQWKFDYLVGAQLEGFETMVGISDAPRAVFEGDEYLASALDLRPKMVFYLPHVLIITGVAWDHINVFPTWENYVDQFRQVLKAMPEGGKVIYYEEDATLVELVAEFKNKHELLPYRAFTTDNEGFIHQDESSTLESKIMLPVFGKHNLANLSAAYKVCSIMGISTHDFWNGAMTFQGAAKRLQLLEERDDIVIYQDFAHAPSKVSATVEAIRTKYPDRNFVAFLELHTYSSLNKEFLPFYENSLLPSDSSMVFYSSHTLKMKNMADIDPEYVKKCFGTSDTEVLDHSENWGLSTWVLSKLNPHKKNVVLLMSSGNFGGVSPKKVAEEVLLNFP
jgi:UDP-N-acetylmuramate: L-alanyl-gamma-D-glutamyl-meso-diaminopimelate ligase